MDETSKTDNLPPSMRYTEELKKDLDLSLSNLREKALSAGSMKAKWVGYLAKEKEALAKLNSMSKEYQKVMASKMKGANAFDKMKNMNTEDETMKKIMETKQQVERSLEVIAHAITSLSEFGYDIKNVIDIMKLNG